MKTKKTLYKIILNLLAILVSAILLIPLLLIVLNSFKTSLDASYMSLAWPSEFQWSNYIEVIKKGKLGITFLNSMVYSSGSVALTVILSSMTAYVLSRRRTPLHKVIFLVISMGVAMPMNYVTLLKVMQVLHLNKSTIGIILLYTVIQIPFNVFLIYGFVGKIPREIDEAGVVDGCTPMTLFVYVIFPLLKPVLVTVAVLTFLNTWNEFILPLYLTGKSTRWPMTLAVYNFFGMHFKDWNLVAADIVLTCLPVITVYVIGQKSIVSGMTSGAVKG